MGFDYSWTCPDIDREIGNAKDCIQEFIVDLLEEACPLLSKKDKEEYATDYTNVLYERLESCFETVRETNVNIREAAEEQISDLEDDMANIEAEIKEKEDEIIHLQDEISSLEDEITQMESEMEAV